MRIAYAIGGQRDGLVFYRIEQPLKLLDELGLASVLEINDKNAHLATKADVVVLPAVFSDREKAAFLKDDGTKLVLDIADNPFETSPYSLSYKVWGLQNVVFNTPDGPLEAWKDGQHGFNIEENFNRHQTLKDFLGFADLVTCTTQRLADVMRQYCKEIAILSDSIDFKKWQPLPLIKEESIVKLWWAGGFSHYEDLKLIADSVEKVMGKHPNVHLYLMGEQFRNGALKLAGFEDRVKRLPWRNTCCYPLAVAAESPDIGLIPLTQNGFNVCKSPLKWAELASLGIPSICSGVPPYSDVYDGQNMAMVVENDLGAWVEAISALVESADIRKQIGRAAYETVNEKYNARTNAKMWMDVYKEVL